MFRMPAYDPVAIAVMGCGILLAAALASIDGLITDSALCRRRLATCFSTHVRCRMVNLKS
jgi:hypothetical protein